MSEPAPLPALVDDLPLGVRTLQALQRARLVETADLLQRMPCDLLKLRGFGRTSLADLEALLEQHGRRLPACASQRCPTHRLAPRKPPRPPTREERQLAAVAELRRAQDLARRLAERLEALSTDPADRDLAAEARRLGGNP